MRLYDLIIKSAEKAVKLQAIDGSMPEGHNGPWNYPDTPVRNTAHWLITFLKAYEITRKRKFGLAAKKAAAYIISEKARPYGRAFFCQRNPSHSLTNGLIGQAWAIEALAMASRLNKEYGKIAEEVFLLHPFDYKLGLWKYVGLNGESKIIHETFNQQLWFAAAGLLLSKRYEVSEEASLRIKRFLNMLDKNIELHSNGLIHHQISRKKIYTGIISILYALEDLKNRQTRHYGNMERGYHSFNLYAFAMLKQECGLEDYKFWQSPKFKKLLSYAITEDYKKKIGNNKYSFSYNQTGFEIAFALETFKDLINLPDGEIAKWLSSQLKCSNTSDPNTFHARIYEATRLKNMEIK